MCSQLIQYLRTIVLRQTIFCSESNRRKVEILEQDCYVLSSKFQIFSVVGKEKKAISPNSQNEDQTMFGKRKVTFMKQENELLIGDVLKLGRIALKVYQNNKGDIHQDSLNNLDLEDVDGFSTFQISASQNVEEMCRICYSNDEENGPLINPCKCSGSVSFVHLSCLRKWFQLKANIKILPFGKTFEWKSTDCEICGTKFPDVFDFNGKSFPLIEPQDVVYGRHFILEILPNNVFKGRGFFVFETSFHDSVIFVSSLIKGRSNEASVFIDDISVSRSHAELKFVKGKAFIYDLDSKFGTIVKAPKRLEIPLSKEKVSIQIGRTLISIETLQRNHFHKRFSVSDRKINEFQDEQEMFMKRYSHGKIEFKINSENSFFSRPSSIDNLFFKEVETANNQILKKTKREIFYE